VSRELDALIAEKVMGWKRTEDLTREEVVIYIKEGWQSDREPTDRDIHNQHMSWICGGECDCASWMRPDGLPVTEIGLPHYSTDITTAWNAFWTVAGNPYKWAIYPDHGSVEVEHYPDDYCGDREAGSGDWSVEGPLAFTLCQAMLWIVDWKMCQ